MSEERELAMQMAIKALLLAARTQGVHVQALCEGAVDLIGANSGLSKQSVIAATAIQRMAYEVSTER
jgi:hypothetical protein